MCEKTDPKADLCNKQTVQFTQQYFESRAEVKSEPSTNSVHELGRQKINLAEVKTHKLHTVIQKQAMGQSFQNPSSII